jgi:hypothetical protein
MDRANNTVATAELQIQECGKDLNQLAGCSDMFNMAQLIQFFRYGCEGDVL